jgi:hypothetical protein
VGSSPGRDRFVLLMGLRVQAKPGDLFTAAWVGAVKSVPERGMAASIRLYELSGEPVYNPTTDEWSTPETTLYSGKARVQPLRSANLKKVAGNETTTITYLFSVPIENAGLDIRTGQQVEVTDSPLNPSLETYLFVVSEIADSSNPVERTFMAVVNQETEA